MRIILLFLLIIMCVFITGCSNKSFSKDDFNKNLEDKYDIKKIILDNIEYDGKVFAIVINQENEEKLIYYSKEVVEDQEVFQVIDVATYNLKFSFYDLLKHIDFFTSKEERNAYYAIINNSTKTEIDDNPKIKKVFQIKNNETLQSVACYYNVNGKLEKFIFTEYLGQYYICNESTEEVYFPIFLKYDEL